MTVVSQVCCLREDGNYHEAIAGLIRLVNNSEGTWSQVERGLEPRRVAVVRNRLR